MTTLREKLTENEIYFVRDSKENVTLFFNYQNINYENLKKRIIEIEDFLVEVIEGNYQTFFDEGICRIETEVNFDEFRELLS